MYFKNKVSCMWYTLKKNISKICKYNYNYFLNKKNVQGIGCGYKIKNGFPTLELCIQVFVSKKLSKCNISKNNMIPLTFKGIKTDVIETGFFTSCSLTEKIRPVQGGYSISASLDRDNYYGTAGCLVTNGVLKFILSTNHVLCNGNKLPLGTPIIQPAYKYGGESPTDTIGTLHKFIPLRFIERGHQIPNLSDCAIGLLSKPNILDSKIAFIGTLKGVKSPILSSNVQKVGATSELTKGVITNLDATFVNHNPDGSESLFKDQIVTTLMAQKGDSGSVLVNKNKYAVGLLVSRGINNTCYSRMDIVLDQLDVKIIT